MKTAIAMTQQIPYSNAKLGKTINPEQLTQIVEAILAGKYSWACFLLLRCMGYNPLHYIPYRTYNRLVKENCQIGIPRGHETNNIKPDIQCSETRSNNAPLRQHGSKLTDLDYLEVINEQQPQVRGGNLAHSLESNSLKIKWLLPKNQGFSEFN
jgi:hypothetical protein